MYDKSVEADLDNLWKEYNFLWEKLNSIKEEVRSLKQELKELKNKPTIINNYHYTNPPQPIWPNPVPWQPTWTSTSNSEIK